MDKIRNRIYRDELTELWLLLKDQGKNLNSEIFWDIAEGTLSADNMKEFRKCYFDGHERFTYYELLDSVAVIIESIE